MIPKPSIPHPLPYQGSKRALASRILKFFPKQEIRLIEPFAGSAAVALAAAANRRVSRVLLNDLNEPLMRLWERIICDPKGLSKAYARLWERQSGREREYYDEVRTEFNRTREPEFLLFLLARCVKASVRYNSEGEFNQSPDNRRKGVRPETMALHLHGASRLLKGICEIQTGDYREAIKNAGPEDVIYMDPPYQGVCGGRDNRYLVGLPFEEFADSLREMNARRLSCLISYDGRTGNKVYGRILPEELRLHRIEIDAGVSTQSTLLGENVNTIESLYLSPALMKRVGRHPAVGTVLPRSPHPSLF